MLVKRIFDLTISLISFFLLSPVIALSSLAILASSGSPVLFKQKRWGRGKTVFTMYKFRTMAVGAEKKKEEIAYLNEADGPVFKIYNDPRYTKIGKILAHTGLDELPQLINVLRGEMSLVGPRPLPVSEAQRVPTKYARRFSVLPGITSSWIVAGSHNLSFAEWMKLDLEYVRQLSLWKDLKILATTWVLMLKWLSRKLFTG